MNQSNNSKQVLLSVIGVAILVVAVVGVSFAFFNYTRTGPANTVGTGEIHFTTSQSTVPVTNLFPVATTDVTASTTANVATTTVTIEGWTNYAGGLDYTVTAEEVDTKGLPIKVKVFADGATTSGATLLGNGAATALTTGTSTTIATGHIAQSATAPSTMPTGTIKVVAFLDASDILITDTDSRVTAPTGYTNGTDATGKTVVTTDQWNALATTPATFRIKVVSTEGPVTP